jgi:hypothetical protein
MARFALIVGIAQYGAKGLAQLEKTTTDAEAVAQVLEQYGNFTEVKRLPSRINSETQKRAMVNQPVTANELWQAIETLLNEQARNNEALIYFTGHGLKAEGRSGKLRGYLATSDCQIKADVIKSEGNKDEPRITEVHSAILFDDLNDLISKSELSSLVVLLDCCHSGNFIERNLIEHSFGISLKKNYYLIAACRGFQEAKALRSEAHSVFTGAVLKSLSPENAGSDGQVTGDRLFDCIGRELKQSGQEPLRMGWGGSITVVSYGEGDRSPVSAPAPVTPANNTFVITGSTIGNISGTGQINHTEAPSVIRDLTINLPSFPPTPSPASSTQLRCQRLRKELNDTIELLEDYKQEERLASNPKDRQRAKIEQERLQQHIEKYEQEINDLRC